MKEVLEILDHVTLNFLPTDQIALNVTIAFLLLVMANVQMFNLKILTSEIEFKGITRIASWWRVRHIICGFTLINTTPLEIRKTT